LAPRGGGGDAGASSSLAPPQPESIAPSNSTTENLNAIGMFIDLRPCTRGNPRSRPHCRTTGGRWIDFQANTVLKQNNPLAVSCSCRYISQRGNNSSRW